MDRTAALNTLTEKYRELAVDAKFTSQQTTDAYNAAIDMSLRYLQFQEADLATADVAQADILKYLALLDYFALERFSTLLSIKFDVKAGQGAIDAARSQAFDRVTTLLARAENKLSSLGIDIGGNGQGMQIGRLNLDFLEPSMSGSEF